MYNVSNSVQSSAKSRLRLYIREDSSDIDYAHVHTTHIVYVATYNGVYMYNVQCYDLFSRITSHGSQVIFTLGSG